MAVFCEMKTIRIDNFERKIRLKDIELWDVKIENSNSVSLYLMKIVHPK